MQGLLEARDDAVALGRARVPRHEVVVVQRDTPGPELGQPAQRVNRVERGPRRLAERVAAGVADRPQAEGEAVLGTWRQRVGHAGSSIDDRAG